MQERREHVRMQAAVLVEFVDPATSQPERSFTRDLSLTGMRFPTAVKFQVGQEVPFMLDLPSPQAPFHATGRIVWIREIARAGEAQYEVGARFHWVEDPDQQRLGSFLRARVSSIT
jgi:c-di-GMP-binding flagellar brake protein YcgR